MFFHKKVFFLERVISAMEFLRSMEVTGLPDNFPNQQKDRSFFKRNNLNFVVKNNPAYCWTGKLPGKPLTPL